MRATDGGREGEVINRQKLAAAIRAVQVQKFDSDGNPTNAYELLKVLARLAAGQFVNDGLNTRTPQEGDASDEVVFEAFGAPGDWGYGTPIGDALAKE